MTRVKVCGLTRAEDVRRAASLGAWALGFVLCPSPRRVMPERARRLAAEAGRALTVAVVATEAPEEVAALLAAGGLGAVQLSAGADGPTVAQVREAARRRDLSPTVIAAADAADAEAADLVLLDSRTGRAYGGTGHTLDWVALAAAPRRTRRPLVLAGGLGPENVATAITLLRPAAVDVSSGVEAAPGVKDPSRLAAFFAAVAEADGGSRSLRREAGHP